MLNRTQRTALRPMAAMAESIAELRATGQHELADALTRLREDWARAAARFPHRHVLDFATLSDTERRNRLRVLAQDLARYPR